MQFGKILALGLVLALGGCASFTKDEVAPVTLPSMANYANKPNVYVDFDFYQGEPKSASAVEVPQARDQLKPQLQKILTDSGLFGRVTLDEFQKQPGDYSLRLKMYNHPPNAGSMVLAFISGFSMMIIPAYGSDQYTLSLEALDGQGQAVTTASNHDAIGTWIGIWFIPLMANTPKDAVNDTFTRQVNALLKQMVDNNNLKYSALDAGIPRA
ncbi:hypothetical protein CXF97_27450 [Pseudomonas sp. Choline-02u-1]|jgi:hypothetical protein|uniref:hypothetical protein n=1 Tax=unclassified Pseudomonas TaxID=196821 RepID=UPI000C32C2AB|nr:MULTISPECIES: hypothetical protein [unclassified Pseudomonas]PKH77015.1 hypothetical protein CXF97_27450 [Pseudomonas sp. Choline-02u-1]